MVARKKSEPAHPSNLKDEYPSVHTWNLPCSHSMINIRVLVYYNRFVHLVSHKKFDISTCAFYVNVQGNSAVKNVFLPPIFTKPWWNTSGTEMCFLGEIFKDHTNSMFKTYEQPLMVQRTHLFMREG